MSALHLGLLFSGAGKIKIDTKIRIKIDTKIRIKIDTKIRIKINTKVKGGGQECPPYTRASDNLLAWLPSPCALDSGGCTPVCL